MVTLPYVASMPYGLCTDDFEPFADAFGSLLLHSSLFNPKWGRFSFWAINPLAVFESTGGWVTFQDHTTIGSPLEGLKELYKKIEGLPTDSYLPFCGGLVGFLGYEWGTSLENILPQPSDQPPFLPDSLFGLYDTVVGYDHLEKGGWVSSLGLNENFECEVELAKERAETLSGRIQSLRRGRYRRTPPRPHDIQCFSSFNRRSYQGAVQKILDYLRAGDCYQVNLSQRFVAPTALSGWQLYLRLSEISPAPYAAYLQCGSYQILSSSPECFLGTTRDGRLMTRPVKGTRRRGQTPEEDARLRYELSQSEKDKAELLMITDLERNDLGKICVPGTVEVPELQTVESFEQVHHLVSTVLGKKRQDVDIIDCLSALMPGGSITGAPKIRAMEIIRELEPVKRGIYTGAIGWIGPANTAQLNIAIRTMILQDATAYLHAGGGIVIDSDPIAEYEESLTKAKGMMEALGLRTPMQESFLEAGFPPLSKQIPDEIGSQRSVRSRAGSP